MIRCNSDKGRTKSTQQNNYLPGTFEVEKKNRFKKYYDQTHNLATTHLVSFPYKMLFTCVSSAAGRWASRLFSSDSNSHADISAVLEVFTSQQQSSLSAADGLRARLSVNTRVLCNPPCFHVNLAQFTFLERGAYPAAVWESWSLIDCCLIHWWFL